MNFHERVISMTTGSLLVLVCEDCGSVILHKTEDINAHTKFHEALAKTADSANYADAMIRPIGGPA